MVKYLSMLAAVALLSSCATTAGYYFNATPKTPATTLCKIQIGYGITVTEVNGKKVSFGPGPAELNLPAGEITLSTEAGFFYHFQTLRNTQPDANDTSILGNLYSAVVDSGIGGANTRLTIHPKPQENWFVGMEFSRSVLEMGKKMDVVAANSSTPLDTSKPQVRLVARLIDQQPSTMVTGHTFAKIYVGPMTPFFSADSRRVMQSQGGSVRIIEVSDSATSQDVKLGNDDLVWGEVAPDGMWWFGDVKGHQFVVDPATLKVVREQKPTQSNLHLKQASDFGSFVMVQNGHSELRRFDYASMNQTGVWTAPEPLVDWSVAKQTGDVAMLTANAIILAGLDGKVKGQRSLIANPIDALDWHRATRVALSPSGAKLAYLDRQSRVWLLSTNDLQAFPQDEWKIWGHSDSDLIYASGVDWLSDDTTIRLIKIASGNDIGLYDYHLGNATSNPLVIRSGLFAADSVTIGTGTGLSAPDLVSFTMSPDGMKGVAMVAVYGRTIFSILVLDTTWVAPVKVKVQSRP